MSPFRRRTFRTFTYQACLLAYCACVIHGITLFSKEESYAIYDVWNATTIGKLKFRFKTKSDYCLLLYVDDTKIKRDSEYPDLVEPADRRRRNGGNGGNYIQLKLNNRGTLELSQQAANENENERHVIEAGYELNDLRWHDVTLTKTVQKTELDVDGVVQSIEFKKATARRFKIESNLYIGGLSDAKRTDSETVDRAYGNAGMVPSFVGCIESMFSSSGDLQLSPVGRIVNGAHFDASCVNKCEDMNICRNNAQCRNEFVRTTCDCFGSGFEGDICDQPADTFHLGERDLIEWRTDPVETGTLRLRLRFKTLVDRGILFYSYYKSDTITIELSDGRIHMSVTMLQDKSKVFSASVRVATGDLLDARWHTVDMERRFTDLNINVDTKSRATIALPYDPIESEPDIETTLSGPNERRLYFGGVTATETRKQARLASKRNFVGCLQQLQYKYKGDTIDVIHKARQIYTHDPTIKKIGRILLGCPFNRSNIIVKTTAVPSTHAPVAPTRDQGGTEEELDRANKGGLSADSHEADSDITIGKGVIVWITAAIVVGTIIIMISAACIVHHIRMKYSGKITTVVKSDDDYGSTELTATRSDRTIPQLVSLSDGIMTPFNLPPLLIGRNTEVSVKFISCHSDDEHTL